MPAEITLPVYIRVGNHPEAHFGDVTIPVPDGEAKVSVFREEMAAFLRVAADELENASEDDKEVPGAAS